MCELYVKADPILYESRSRSLRICGVVTTLRLENQFWDILSEIAEVDGMTTNQLIAKLYEEVMDYRGEVVNFASFLRVSCMRYLSQRRVQTPELSVVRAAVMTGRPLPLRGDGGIPLLRGDAGSLRLAPLARPSGAELAFGGPRASIGRMASDVGLVR